MRCKRCGYPIHFVNPDWTISHGFMTEHEEYTYSNNMDSFAYSCRDGKRFKPHEPEEKSNNFKLIYDILNDE